MTTPVFPYLPGLGFPVERSAGLFDTTKQEAMSGKAVYFANRTQARYRYTLSFDGLDSSGASWPGLIANTQQTLIGFFNQILGGARVFNFYDVDDCLATLQGFGTGDGTTTTFQLARAIGNWSDYIYAPILTSVTVPLPGGGTGTVANAAPSIYINGSLQSSGYTISSTGLVTFSSAPAAAAALTATFNYYWPCHFDDDSLALSKFMGGLWEGKKLSFTTWIP